MRTANGLNVPRGWGRLPRPEIVRLRVAFHLGTLPPCSEVVSLTADYDSRDLRLAAAGSQGWPAEVARRVCIDGVEVLS
jgi:hypothetical protein